MLYMWAYILVVHFSSGSHFKQTSTIPQSCCLYMVTSTRSSLPDPPNQNILPKFQKPSIPPKTPFHLPNNTTNTNHTRPDKINSPSLFLLPFSLHAAFVSSVLISYHTITAP